MRRLKQGGFTIVELMIATVVFSMVLLVVTSAIVQFGRVYYKGVVQSRTQERARSITEDITKTIQFSRGIPSAEASAPSGYKYRCIGDRRYTYKKDVQQSSMQPVLRVENITGGCSTSPIPGANAKELMGEGMQLLDLIINEDPSGSGLWKVEVKLIYGSNSNMNGSGPNKQCKSIILGGQFCARSEFTTTVSKRLR